MASNTRFQILTRTIFIVLGALLLQSSTPRPVTTVKRAGVDALLTQDLTQGQTVEDVIAALLGSPSIAVSNVRFTGSDSALGTFVGGTGIIGFENGIILSTGEIEHVIGPNEADNVTGENGRDGDSDLDSLIPGFETHDAAILEFDFSCDAVRKIGFEYVFASEEYNEYVNASFNDVFGFFVNGKNVALLPDGHTVVAINTVNGGNPLGDSASNPQYYRNNDECQGTDKGCSINTEMDGLTVVLIAEAEIHSGLNHIKLAIADAGDYSYDSDVFIKGASFVCGIVNNSAPTCSASPAGPLNGPVNTLVGFTVTGTDPDSGQTIYLSALGNLPAGATMTPALPLAGPRTGVSSQFSWLPTQPGTYFAHFFLTDSLGGADTCSVQINAINNPPACLITPAGPFTVSPSTLVNFTVSGSDPDNGQSIHLFVLGALPGGATMTPTLPRNGPNTGVSSQFSWQPTQPGIYSVRFYLTDSLGGADTCETQITVGNSPPVCTITPAGPFTVSTSSSVNFTVSGTDPDDGQRIHLSLFETLPGGANMTPALPLNGPNTGISSQFSWQPTQPGSYFFRFLLSDSVGGLDTASAQINVTETDPPPYFRQAVPTNGSRDVPWIQLRVVTLSPSEELADSTIPANISVHSRRHGTITGQLQYTSFPPATSTVLMVDLPNLQYDDDSVSFSIPATITDLGGNGLDGNRDGLPHGSPVDDYNYWITTSPGVRPGDADDDGSVDERDILPLAIFWFTEGSRRARNTDTWTVEPATPWNPRGATYADCDGSGFVDSLDICAVAEFFGRTELAKRSNGAAFGVLSSLSIDIRAALASALLNCDQATSEARIALLTALNQSGDISSGPPKSFALLSNYPNPFNSGTIIRWEQASAAQVDLSIFDILGHPIRKLIDTSLPAGLHTLAWDGKTEGGADAASGVYLVRLRTGNSTQTHLMALVR